MKQLIALIAFAALTASTQAADPKETATAAAKALGEKAGYSWTSTAEFGTGGNFTPRPLNGKTEKGGFTSLKQEGFNDNMIEVYQKGGKAVLKTEEGWKTADELPAPGQGGGQGRGRGGFGGRQLLNTKAPAADLAEIVAGAKELKEEGGVISGPLSDEAAKAGMTFGRGGGRGGNQNPPKNAKGSVKIWVKDGVVSKYQTKYSGTMTTRDGEDRDFERTTTVEIKDVGATKVEAPEDVKKKLGA